MNTGQHGDDGKALRGEQDLLRRVQRLLHQPEAHVRTGIGDDCAVLALPGASEHLIVTTDLLIEHIHFELSHQSPQQLGAKAVTVNLSDLAASGAQPLGALVAIAVPSHCDGRFIEQLYGGMEEVAQEAGTSIVGGDSSRSTSGLILNLTLLGAAPPEAVVLRSGAQEGDLLFVTGALGDAAAGLEILTRVGEGERSAAAGAQSDAAAELCRRFRLPTARLAEGQWLGRQGVASAMLDLSDGLSTDLHRLCEASHVGARLEIEALPLSEALQKAGEFLQHEGERYSLHGGEDYELLFSVPPHHRPALLQSWPFATTRLTQIGMLVAREAGVVVVTESNEAIPLIAGGYDHFAARRDEPG